MVEGGRGCGYGRGGRVGFRLWWWFKICFMVVEEILLCLKGRGLWIWWRERGLDLGCDVVLNLSCSGWIRIWVGY